MGYSPIKRTFQFKYFFRSATPNIQPNLKQTFRSFHYHLTNPSEDLFIKFPCTKEKILEIISKFDSNKETGKNSIPPNLVK